MSGIIANPGKVWLAVEMCRGIDGLSMIVQHTYDHSPSQGQPAFMFCNRASNRCCGRSAPHAAQHLGSRRVRAATTAS